MSAVLFIDANQYLNIYGVVDGKKLLDLLEQQKAYIFISRQMVDEVLRNKVRSASVFFSAMVKEIKETKSNVPDHLFGISDREIKQFRKTIEGAQATSRKLAEHAAEALRKISRSEDDVSKRLESLFDNAFTPTNLEMQLATERKERGNPPGKPRNPLGDELIWEQLLSKLRKEKIKRIWIITEDRDYYTDFAGKRFLNSFLYQELKTVCGAAFEVNCFDNLVTGVEDFAMKAGAAKSLLTKKESAAIEQELSKLPLVSGIFNALSPEIEVVLNRSRQTAAFPTAFAIDFSRPVAGTAPAVVITGAADLVASQPADDTDEQPK